GWVSFFFQRRWRHTSLVGAWSPDVSSSDLAPPPTRGRGTDPRHPRAAQLGDVLNRSPARESVGELADLALAVTVHEKIRLGVEQDRAAHLLRPIIEVGNATE